MMCEKDNISTGQFCGTLDRCGHPSSLQIQKTAFIANHHTFCIFIRYRNSMRRQISISICLLVLAQQYAIADRQLEDSTIRQRIIGGADAPRGRFPWMIWYFYGGIQCGGSLIAPDLMLTNAHCWNGDDNLGTAYVGRYDKDDRLDAVPDLQVIEAYLHPEYVDETNTNDLAIMKLERVVADAVVVKLNTDSNVPSESGEELLLLGWGSLTDGETAPIQTSSVLQEAPTKYVPFEECAVARDPIRGIEFGFSTEATGVGPDWLCTYDADFAHCSGDSGGPVIKVGSSAEEDLLVGVISGVSGGCKTLVPQINMKVSYNLAWIYETGCAASDNPPAEWDCPEVPTEAPVPATTEAPAPTPTEAPIPAVTPEPSPATTTTSPVESSSEVPSAQPDIPNIEGPVFATPQEAEAPNNSTEAPSVDPLDGFPPVPENSTRVPIYVKIIFNESPQHISWFISDIDYANFRVAVPYGAYRPGELVVNDRVMVDGGDDYIFVISNLMGNGLGGTPPGSFEVFMGREFDYEVLASGEGDFGDNATYVFNVPCSDETCAPTLEPTDYPSYSPVEPGSPTRAPIPRPTPTRSPYAPPIPPTNKPTDSPTTTEPSEDPTPEPSSAPSSEIGELPPSGQPPTNGGSPSPPPSGNVLPPTSSSSRSLRLGVCISFGVLVVGSLFE